MERKDVYEAIDSERAYQDRQNGSVHDEETQTGTWLTYMRFRLSRAEDAECNESHDKLMDEIRKLGALCVACMEEHGCRKR